MTFNAPTSKIFFQKEISNIIIDNHYFFYQFSFQYLLPLLMKVRKFYDKHQTIENLKIDSKDLEFIKNILIGSDKDLLISKNKSSSKTYYDALANLTNHKESIERLLQYPLKFKGSLDLVTAFSEVNPSMGWMINRGFRSNQKGIICSLHVLLITIKEINRIKNMYN